jgi:hypothetical protein
MTNCAFTVFHASTFGRTSGFEIASGKLVGSIGVRKIEWARSLASTAPILVAPSSPASGVTAIVTGVKLAPA